MLRSTYGTGLPATRERTPSSRVLADLLRQAPPEHFTLGWLLSTLHQRSFGVVILFLGILATAPIGSSVPGIMLAAVAVQMIAGVREPIFPQFITERRLPTQYLIRLGERAIPILRYLERVVHPRWPLAFDVARRSVGVMVLLLTATLLLNSGPNQQYTSRDPGRSYLPRLHRGRRTSALPRLSLRAHPDRHRISGGLGHNFRRSAHRRHLAIKHGSPHPHACASLFTEVSRRGVPIRAPSRSRSYM